VNDELEGMWKKVMGTIRVFSTGTGGIAKITFLTV
jgi:hypothetical protein